MSVMTLSGTEGCILLNDWSVVKNELKEMPKEAVVLCLPEVTEENELRIFSFLAEIQTWQSQSTS
jgi:hypothetical protein